MAEAEIILQEEKKAEALESGRIAESMPYAAAGGGTGGSFSPEQLEKEYRFLKGSPYAVRLDRGADGTVKADLKLGGSLYELVIDGDFGPRQSVPLRIYPQRPSVKDIESVFQNAAQFMDYDADGQVYILSGVVAGCIENWLAEGKRCSEEALKLLAVFDGEYEKKKAALHSGVREADSNRFVDSVKRKADSLVNLPINAFRLLSSFLGFGVPADISQPQLFDNDWPPAVMQPVPDRGGPDSYRRRGGYINGNPASRDYYSRNRQSVPAQSYSRAQAGGQAEYLGGRASKNEPVNGSCRRVVLSDRAWLQIYNEAVDRIDTETGGLLLGHFDRGVWYVAEASDPGYKAVFRNIYHEADEDYQNHVCAVISRIYKHPLLFLGMWHRHPGSLDVFTGTDDMTNYKYAGEAGQGSGCLSALINFDPKFRMTFYYAERCGGYMRYTLVDTLCGDANFENKEILQLASLEEITARRAGRRR